MHSFLSHLTYPKFIVRIKEMSLPLDTKPAGLMYPRDETPRQEKTLWKKRMVQSHATADEMNTKFLSHLDLRFESLNKLPGQFNFFQSAIEELKPFIAQQIQKMSENLVNEQRKIEARVSKQVRDVERDYTHKMEQISSQIYDMHK